MNLDLEDDVKRKGPISEIIRRLKNFEKFERLVRSGAFTGAAGSGTGDVVGPAGAVNNDIAIFSGGTGKLIADGGILITSVVVDTEIREKLTAARTYYVRTDGSDSNNGLANTAGGAFLTIQKAINVVAALDIVTFTVTIQVADGAYNAELTLKDPLGSGSCILLGNATTPANVTITIGQPITSSGMSKWTVNGFKIQASGNYAVHCTGGLLTLTNVHFGTAVFAHMGSFKYGTITVNSNYTIAGAAPAHFYCESGRLDCRGRTITLTGTPAFSNFAWVTQLGYLLADGNTFSGAATGNRYSVAMNGVINTAAGGANYFPGNAAGSSATGGQYV